MLKIKKVNKPINLIVALGNIGKDYSKTRHNTGFLFADRLEELFNIKGLECVTESAKDAIITIFPTLDLRIIKPTTMMNNSGRAVSHYIKMNLSEKFNPSMLLVHDDLDIKLGEYKIQNKKSPRKHNGVSSVESAIQSLDFWRLRIGIDNRNALNKESGLDYVLKRFSAAELIIIKDLFDNIIDSEFSLS